MKKAIAVCSAFLFAAMLTSCLKVPQGISETQPPDAQAATAESPPAQGSLSDDKAAIDKYTGQLKQTDVADFALKDLAGKEWKLSDLKGRIVLLNFWATWCPPCMGELPEFQKLAERYGPDGPFVLLTAASAGLENKDAAVSWEEIRKLASDQSFTFPILFDEDGKVWQAYQNNYVPVTYIIGPDGKIRLTVVGAFKNAEDVLAALEAVRRADSGR